MRIPQLKNLKTGKKVEFNLDAAPKRLGRGTFGQVFEVTKGKDASKRFAIKEIQKYVSWEDPEKTKKKVEKEAQVNAKLGREAYFGEDAYNYYIAIENFGTDLFTLAHSNRDPNASSLFFIQVFMRIASQLMQMHQNGYEHFDIKNGNIASQSAFHHPRLIDMDFAKKFKTTYSISTGTPIFTAPEIVLVAEEGSSFTVKGQSDVFSLGVTFLEMMLAILLKKDLQRLLPETQRDLFDQRRNNENEFGNIILSILDHGPVRSNSDELKHYKLLTEIMKKMLERNPEERFTSTTVYLTLAIFRFHIELFQNKDKPDVLKALFHHNMSSQKLAKRVAFTTVLLKEYPEAIEAIFDHPEENKQPEKDLPKSERETLNKCQELVKKAKKHWETELLESVKSDCRVRGKIDQYRTLYYFDNFVVALQLNPKNSTDVNVDLIYNEKKVSPSSDKTLHAFKMLTDKIEIAKTLLKPDHDLKTFKETLTSKNRKTIAHDRSPLIQRIFRSIAEILFLPVAIIHTAKKGTFIWKSHGSKLMGDINKTVGEAEKNSRSTLSQKTSH